MKRVFSKTYSLKSTFMMVFKCLVLMFAFVFVGVVANEEKVGAAGSTFTYNKHTNFDSYSTPTGYHTFTVTTKYSYYYAQYSLKAGN